MENDINTAPPIRPIPNPENSFVKKSFTPKFIVVIVGLLILGGSAYGYTTYLAKKNFDEVTRLAEEGRVQQEALKQKRLSNSSDISSWQTYRNDEFGFEIQHPSGWEIKTDESNNGKQVFVFIDSTGKVPIAIMPQGEIDFDFPFNEDPAKTIIQLGGARASQWTWSNFASVKVLDTKPNWTKDNAIVLRFEDKDLIDQILSTFKFIK